MTGALIKRKFGHRHTQTHTHTDTHRHTHRHTHTHTQNAMWGWGRNWTNVAKTKKHQRLAANSWKLGEREGTHSLSEP